MKLKELFEVMVIDRPKTGAPVHPKEMELNKPGGFNVVILNDEITPAEVVVEALMAAVGLSKAAATKRMLRTHRGGWFVVATYSSADVAETIAERIMQHARGNTGYDHYRTHPSLPATHPIRRHKGPWPLAAEVMEAGGD